PAEFRALAAIDAWTIGPNPQRRRVARNQIAFALKVRDPEAVDDIAGIHLEHDRAADGNVNLVRRGDTQAGIRILVLDGPPPLIAGDVDCDGARRSERGKRSLDPEARHQDAEQDDRGR